MATSDDTNRYLRTDWLVSRAGSVGYSALVWGTIAFLLAPLVVVVIISFQDVRVCDVATEGVHAETLHVAPGATRLPGR